MNYFLNFTSMIALKYLSWIKYGLILSNFITKYCVLRRKQCKLDRDVRDGRNLEDTFHENHAKSILCQHPMRLPLGMLLENSRIQKHIALKIRHKGLHLLVQAVSTLEHHAQPDFEHLHVRR